MRINKYEKECEYAKSLEKEMKTCPFCGGKAKILHYENDGYLPMCSDCNGMIEEWFDTPEKAVEKWNERVS